MSSKLIIVGAAQLIVPFTELLSVRYVQFGKCVRESVLDFTCVSLTLNTLYLAGLNLKLLFNNWQITERSFPFRSRFSNRPLNYAINSFFFV